VRRVKTSAYSKPWRWFIAGSPVLVDTCVRPVMG
jgi:hypothetical protein